MDKNQQEEMRKKWAQIVAKAWTDEKFKKRLISNPEQVLKEEGLNIPSGMHCKILEDSRQTAHLILPAKPQGNLSETELKKVAGGPTPTNWTGGTNS